MAAIPATDLLPLPYSEEALGIRLPQCRAGAQALGTAILVENPSTYSGVMPPSLHSGTGISGRPRAPHRLRRALRL